MAPERSTPHRRWPQFSIATGIVTVAWLALLFASIRDLAFGTRQLGDIGLVLWGIASGIWLVRNSVHNPLPSFIAGAVGGTVGKLLADGIRSLVSHEVRPHYLKDTDLFLAEILIVGFLPGALLGFVFGVAAEIIRTRAGDG